MQVFYIFLAFFAKNRCFNGLLSAPNGRVEVHMNGHCGCIHHTGFLHHRKIDNECNHPGAATGARSCVRPIRIAPSAYKGGYWRV